MLKYYIDIYSKASYREIIIKLFSEHFHNMTTAGGNT